MKVSERSGNKGRQESVVNLREGKVKERVGKEKEKK